ncbi:MAG: hypothetical protein ACTSX8_03245 [Alphaproteobacteria bacterium]
MIVAAALLKAGLIDSGDLERIEGAKNAETKRQEAERRKRLDYANALEAMPSALRYEIKEWGEEYAPLPIEVLKHWARFQAPGKSVDDYYHAVLIEWSKWLSAFRDCQNNTERETA